MPDKITINIEGDKATITEGENSGVAKILLAAKKIKVGGKEVKVEKPK